MLRHGAHVTSGSVTAGAASLRLRPPRHSVDPRAVTWWRLESAAQWAVLLVAGGAVLLFVQPLWLVLIECAIAVIACIDVAVLPVMRYRRHRFEATEQAVYVRDGVFLQDWRVAPLSRVQTVDTNRGPLQQWLGLSTVIVTTASTAGALKIHGLDKDVAAQLVEHLSAATEDIPGDAT